MARLVNKIHRRIAPESYRRRARIQRIKEALAPWGGANLPSDHPFFLESMFKQADGSQEVIDLRLKSHPHIPLLVRTGTADPNPFRQVFLEQQYADLPLLAPQATTILDLGANVGYSAIWLAMMFPQATVYAVEPLPENYVRLEKQIQTAGMDAQIKTLEAAISAQDKSGAFFQFEEGFFHTSGSLIADARHHEMVSAVACLSLPSILDRFGLAGIDVLKVDVEGTEGELFADPPESFRKIMADCRVVAIEAHGAENARIVEAFFSSLGWQSKSRSEIVCYYPAP